MVRLFPGLANMKGKLYKTRGGEHTARVITVLPDGLEVIYTRIACGKSFHAQVMVDGRLDRHVNSPFDLVEEIKE